MEQGTTYGRIARSRLPWALLAAIAISSRCVHAASTSPASAVSDFDLRTNLLDATDGAIGADLDVGVIQGFAVGPSFHYFQGVKALLKSEVTEWGLVGTYFMDGPRFGTGWFGRLGYYFLKGRTRSTNSNNVSLTAYNRVGNVTGGYEWRLHGTPWLATTGLGVTWPVSNPYYKLFQVKVELDFGLAF